MRLRANANLLLCALTVAWFLAAAGGMWAMHRYDATAGALAAAPTDWPAGTSLTRDAGRFTLVVFMHPRCPCSRATVDTLVELAARAKAAGAGQRLAITVCMDRPAGLADGWERTDLWQRAAKVDGVRLISDVNGAEAHRFGAETSGQAMLYDAAGRLQFNGGLTDSRGHAGGSSTGMDAVLQSIGGAGALNATAQRSTPVYGCELFTVPTARRSSTLPTTEFPR